MDGWRSDQRVQERHLWRTLTVVGAVLTLTLVSSLAIAVGSDAVGSGADDARLPLQQAVLLVLSIAGTATALRRWRALRAVE